MKTAPTQVAPYTSYTSSGQTVTNPLKVPNADPYQVWETVVDVVRLYFDRIESEFPCQRTNGIITEGVLVTRPQTAATIFEPWRRDSVGCDQRHEATVQSIRRTAKVRVRYDGDHYKITVEVLKELEDLATPSDSQLPSATFRLDTDVPEVHDPIAVQAYNEGWIPQGRDAVLEREILRHIQTRLAR